MSAVNSPLRLLVVEDSPTQAQAIQATLESEGFQVQTAPDVQTARELLRRVEFALALVDVGLPGESGVELVRHIVTEHPDTATVITTASNDRAVADAALDLGAYAYFIKPINRDELLINISSALRRRDRELKQRIHRQTLEQTVRDRTVALQQAVRSLEQAENTVRSSQEETLLRLARAGECRDDETGRHVQRMSRYCALLASRMGYDSSRCELIRLASTLHDVGKIGIPDEILRKPGPLTSPEFEIMKRHVDIGHRILTGSQSRLLRVAAIVAWTHHEKYDGTGYPRRLCGEAIPQEGRIAAIADVFDALTSNRVYRQAFSLDKSLSIMCEGKGKHFDPALLEPFLDSIDDILAIRDEYRDPALVLEPAAARA
jgi:putative two-component system response regulator